MAEVVSREVFPRVIVTGVVLPARTSIVASGANGVVEQFQVKVGQYVKEGDVLSVLRMQSTERELEEAQALLEEREQAWSELKNGFREEEVDESRSRMLAARAVMENTQARLKRTQKLFGQKIARQDDLDDVQEKADAARNLFDAAVANHRKMQAGPRPEQIGQARAAYKAQKARIAFLESEKAKRITRAPFDGFIVREQTENGQWLAKGDPVVTLTDLKWVAVVANVDEKSIHHVRRGETVELEVNHPQYPKWSGRVSYIIDRSEWQSGSHGFPVKVVLKNRFAGVEPGEDSGIAEEPANRTGGTRSSAMAYKPIPILKEGMTARITFVGEPMQAVLVPKDAVIRSSRGTIVYVYDSEKETPGAGRVRPVPVTEGIEDESQVQVIGEGIVQGVQVVVEGAERLRPFQEVRVLPESQSGPTVKQLAGKAKKN